MIAAVVQESSVVSRQPALELVVGANGIKEAILDAVERLEYGPSGFMLGFDNLSGRLQQAEGLIEAYPEVDLDELQDTHKLGKFFIDLNKLIIR